MFSTFVRWLAVLIALFLGTGAVTGFLWGQGHERIAIRIGAVGNLLMQGWIVYALWRWREVPWVRRLGWALILTVMAAAQYGLFKMLGWEGGAQVVAGAWAMAMLFLVGLVLMRLVLSLGHPVIGIARTTLDESIRMKTPLVFIVIVMLMVPMLPTMVAGEQQLRYQLQTFLTWSLMVVGGMLSLMTIFLAVGTVAGEFQQKRIYMTLTKPVGRAQYLAGKWLGICALNLVLVAVSGAGIYGFTQLLAQRDASNDFDALAVKEEVLVARRMETPKPTSQTGLAGMFAQRLERLRREDPGTYGRPGDPIDSLPQDVRLKIEQQVVQTWYTVGPGNRTVYRFTGLHRVPASAHSVQFRFKPKAVQSPPDGFVRFRILLNDRPYLNPYPDPELQGTPFFKYADNKYHVLVLPVEAIDDQGNLDIEVGNLTLAGMPPQSSLTFNTKDGLEVLYKVDSFEANLLRTMIIVWLRLMMLAMLGLMASTFLGFPVACLFSLLFFAVAAGHGYITESIGSYGAFPRATLPLWDRIVGVPITIGDKFGEGKYWDGVKVIVRVIGTAFVSLVPSFSEYNATPLVSNGRDVSWRLVGRAILWVGVIWTGVLALVAYVLFRIREIARVIV